MASAPSHVAPPADAPLRPQPPIVELVDSERPLFLKHLLSLGPVDRHLRFGSALSDLAVRRYVDRIDFGRDTIFGVYDDRLAIVAAGHFAPLPAESPLALPAFGRTAEFGLSVAEGARRRGLGSAIFRRAATHARNDGVASLFMHCLSENRAMMRIARGAGMQIRQRAGEADAYLALPPGTAATVAAEGAERRVAMLDFEVKRRLLAGRTASA